MSVSRYKYVDGERVEMADAEYNDRVQEANLSSAREKLNDDFPSVSLTTEEKDALSNAGVNPVPIRKAAMREESKRRRQQHAIKPVTYDTNSFQADSNSQQKIQGAIERARADNANNSDTWSTQWKLADNTFTEVTQSDLESVFALVADQVESAYNREAEINGDIDTATTIDDLNAIDVTSGWP